MSNHHHGRNETRPGDIDDATFDRVFLGVVVDKDEDAFADDIAALTDAQCDELYDSGSVAADGYDDREVR